MYSAELATIALVVLLACMSPGPDFIAVTSNALASRKRGLLVALGISVACAVWAALAIFGLSIVLTHLSWLYDALRLIGAAYLIWLGTKMLLSVRKRPEALAVKSVENAPGSAFRTGFLVGMTNPKSAAFFGSLFVAILPPQPPIWVHVSTISIVLAVAAAWFGCLAVLFSIQRVRKSYQTVRRPIDAIMGVALMGLGARLAFSR